MLKQSPDFGQSNNKNSYKKFMTKYDRFYEKKSNPNRKKINILNFISIADN